MIVVDSSVWIDYFNGTASAKADRLDTLLGKERLAIGDLILVEVLQGFPRDADYRTARALLADVPVLEMLGGGNAVRCAENYRSLRELGVTVRKTADVIIATFCIEAGHALLFSDRDFEPFVEHLGLIEVV